MKKFINGMEFAEVIILIFLSAIVFVQVIMRNIFNTGFVWGEELSRFLLVTIVLIAAPVVFFHNDHVKFDLLPRSLKGKSKNIYNGVSILLIVFFYIVYIVSHVKLMKTSGNVLSPALSLPNYIFFGSGIIGAGIGAAAGVFRLIEEVGRKSN